MTNSRIESNIIQPDSLTEYTYVKNDFSPISEVEKYSYTSHRVSVPAYNTYIADGDSAYNVFGYYTDWSQYDARLDNKDSPNEDLGRGVDITKIPVDAYDKIILGFLGIVGDRGEKEEVINNAASCGTWPTDPNSTSGFCRNKYEVTFTDPWGDVLSYRNCGFPGFSSNDVISHYNQKDAQGVLGALREMKQKNSSLRIGVSIGGWTMSEIFYGLSRDASARSIFTASVIDILRKFDMITDLDIDWEYPGMPGNTGNTFDDDDSNYYQVLIKELRENLNDSGFSKVKISIAANASVEGLSKANIPSLIEAGVDSINLMTYDFFGTPWAKSLAHHSNLYDNHNSGNNFCVENAVKYLVDAGINMKRVYIGYAAYSRNAKNVDIESFSPLKGTYTPDTRTTTGTFESGTTEWYDVINNYLDLKQGKGKNGFNIYTDKIAEADYLYNAFSKLFLSIDTPRTVKLKGEFVQKYGLGGLLTWTADMDNGLLLNAAREGLGFKIKEQVIDMEPFYFEGADSEVPVKPIAHISGGTEVQIGGDIVLSGKNSIDASSFQWEAPGFPFDKSSHIEVKATADTEGDFNVSLNVWNDAGDTDTTSVVISVKDLSIPQWEPKDYGEPNTKVRNNYNDQGEHIYYNNWWANSTDEPGDPVCTGPTGSGKVWTAFS